MADKVYFTYKGKEESSDSKRALCFKVVSLYINDKEKKDEVNNYEQLKEMFEEIWNIEGLKDKKNGEFSTIEEIHSSERFKNDKDYESKCYGNDKNKLVFNGIEFKIYTQVGSKNSNDDITKLFINNKKINKIGFDNFTFEDKKNNKLEKKPNCSYMMNYLIEIIELDKQLILNGAPGTGKTYTAKEVAIELIGENDPEKQIKLVQFHPSYDYTDFVEGYKPVQEEQSSDQLKFKLIDGVFKEFCNNAKDDQNNKYVFIIDEINRAEISKVFGELMFALEPDYREKFDKEREKEQFIGVNLQYSKDTFKIPENVYIIATMNDIDRSVEVFDFAMRRRFAWYEIKANDVMETVLKSMLSKSCDNSKLNDLVERAKKLNNCITEYGKDFGLNEHFHIGPSYFGKFNKCGNNYQKLWDYYIKQILTEYVKGYPGKSEEFVEKCKNILIKEDK
ncbi:dynein-related subfamily AAA family protein [Natranaerovirga pectinivora]|uniref:Dynein-related subfamily AAA family protein n=1 Tax=Natranaerovirga pectinivora TaxID=682400 RepID=A0A4R3MKR8_9FIRM|nr:AAA family ATPase [Natranaerovirga pectinivora]TCT14536.1 dynein-related subfamily AAA family protein [Natranaerovirga pectinivora]